MSKLNAILQKTSSIKTISILFGLSHLVLLAMMVFTFSAINNQIGTQAFDLQTFGYSLSTAETIIDQLDAQTTALYLFPQLTLLDVLYPFLLALFLGSFLFRLIRITRTENRLTSLLLLTPFLAMIFDYLENAFIILLISKSIQVSETIVFLSSTCTVLKGVFTSVAWVAILVFSLIWMGKKIKIKPFHHVIE